MNIGHFMGNLGRDAEVRFASNGDPVANFALAVAVGTKAEPETMWVRCSLYGKRAESLAQYLTKGSKVVVTGRIKLREWQDKEGNLRTELTLNVADVWFAGGRSQDDSARERPAAKPAPERMGGAPFDDEIPF